MTINIEELYAQRSEATGVSGDRVPFEFGGKTFTFRDPFMLTDDEKDELAELEGDIDIAIFYMGEEEYSKLVKTESKYVDQDGKEQTIHGGSNVFFFAFRHYQRQAAAQDAEGKFSRQNRLSRRMAARKRAKQR